MSLASINDQHNDSAQIKRKSLNAPLVVPNRSTDDDDDVDGDYDIRYKALFKASAWLWCCSLYVLPAPPVPTYRVCVLFIN